jgi:competence protein ComEC
MLGSNLLAVPICDLLMATAWLGAGFEALAPGAGRWCLAACEPLSRALVAIARTSASAPSASWATGHSPWPPWLAACGAAFAVLVCLRRRDLEHALLPPSRGRVAMSWAAPLALALSIALGASAPPLLPPRGCWWLVAIDVGQGDALAIGGARGWQLVDAGPRAPTWDAGASAVVPFFQWAAVRRLDAVILTHGHGDHAGGLRAVRRALPVEHWWRTGASAAPRVAASARAAWAGDTLGRDPILAVRWPVAGFESSDLNAGSLVLDVGEGRARAWLAADVDSAVEDQITTSGPCAVLKVAHHGASSSSGVRFLARLRPEWAVISCGTHNPFGHPDPHALLRLASSGARVRRTDRHGTVWLELGNEGVREIDWSRDAFETRIDITPTPTPPGTLARAPSRC